jgi:hypothetical protein
VVIISLKPADKRVQIEKWELAPPDERRPVTRLHPGTQTMIPTQIQEITIMPNDSVTGAPPLVWEFQKIFLRPAIPPESDITITAGDLSRWAADIWAVSI